jgi:hypothetical protein
MEEKMIVTLLALLSSSAIACAADVVELKNGMTFNHKLHQTERVGKCFVCHENVSVSSDGKVVTTTNPGKIKGFGKEWAHKYCKDCHDLYGEGPVACKDCHHK